MSERMEVEHFDVVVVGGGIAGSALVRSLAETELKVALLEAMPREVMLESADAAREGLKGYDVRVSALTASSERFLQAIGAWEQLDQGRALAYSQMFVWDALGTESIRFDASEVHCSALGSIVENRQMLKAIHQGLSDQDNLSLFWGEPVTCIEQESASDQASRSVIQLEHRQLTADLLVAADGANSKMRSILGFETREWDYGQHAIVASVRTEHPHQNTAWQRFSEEGPLAFLPLADQAGHGRYSSIVWSLDSDLAQIHRAMSDQDFALALERGIESRLGRIEELSQRQIFPLRQRHALKYVKGNAVLVADAAHTIHPLAGQGLNLGLKDVAVLSSTLRQAAEQKLPCNSPLLLKRYQRKRQTDNLAMMAAMEGFKRLFGARDPAIRALRNVGLGWVNRQSLLKKAVIRQAMGI